MMREKRERKEEKEKQAETANCRMSDETSEQSVLSHLSSAIPLFVLSCFRIAGSKIHRRGNERATKSSLINSMHSTNL